MEVVQLEKFKRALKAQLDMSSKTPHRAANPTLYRAFVRIEVSMSQPTEKLQERDALAERIAAGLRGREKVGAERQIQKREYQRRNSDRALARHYRLRGELVGQRGAPIPSSVSKVADPRESLPQAISDIQLDTAEVVLPNDKPYVVYLRWNSTNGPVAR